MSDIQKHLKGFATTLAALDLIRRGVSPDEATQRLLIDLAGKDCTGDFTDKELRQLANRLNHAAQNMIKAAHAVHGAFAEALEVNGVIEPAARKPKTNRNEYMRTFMANKRAKERAERNANATAPADR